MKYSLGIDIGSTAAKAVLTDEKGIIIYKKYERHLSRIREKFAEILREVGEIEGVESFSISRQ